jgi:hypothetical protein
VDWFERSRTYAFVRDWDVRLWEGHSHHLHVLCPAGGVSLRISQLRSRWMTSSSRILCSGCGARCSVRVIAGCLLLGVSSHLRPEE